MRKIILSTACAAAFALPAFAQEVVGTAVIDGREAVLYSDNSWRFAEKDNAQSGDCRELAVGLSFCGIGAGWSPTPPPTPEIIAQYRYSDTLYGQYVYEQIGTEAGMNIEFMRDAVVMNAAAASGDPTAEVPIIETSNVVLDGVKGETVVYSVMFGTLPITIMNSIIVGPDRTLQAMTYEVSPELTEEQRARHREFLDLTEFGG